MHNLTYLVLDKKGSNPFIQQVFFFADLAINPTMFGNYWHSLIFSITSLIHLLMPVITIRTLNQFLSGASNGLLEAFQYACTQFLSLELYAFFLSRW